ncbi:MAG TPA: CbtA family protein [Solirubrobacteraceae bacterium]
MIRTLLIWGLLAGLCGGLLATGFSEVAGEPAVNQAIAFESSSAAAAGEPHEHAVVSRGTQRTVGLLTAAVVYGVSVGGLFALAFAFAYGRIGRASPARTALWLATGAFVVVFLVPFLKYPANPPSVGDPDTIGRRTELYLAMIVCSLLAAVAALRIRAWLAARRDPATATVVAGLSYLAVVVAAALILPGVHEVPKSFPATTLWRFREASVGMQAVLWATIGVVFSMAAQRVMVDAPARRRAAATGLVASPGD